MQCTFEPLRGHIRATASNEPQHHILLFFFFSCSTWITKTNKANIPQMDIILMPLHSPRAANSLRELRHESENSKSCTHSCVRKDARNRKAAASLCSRVFFWTNDSSFISVCIHALVWTPLWSFKARQTWGNCLNLSSMEPASFYIHISMHCVHTQDSIGNTLLCRQKVINGAFQRERVLKRNCSV